MAQALLNIEFYLKVPAKTNHNHTVNRIKPDEEDYGKIFVSSLEETIRIRTGETSLNAI